jgi:hypothetical protein
VRLTPKLAEALTHLRGDANFAAVLEGMTAHQTEENQRCIEADGVILQRSQGAYKALQWWIDAFREAPTMHERFKGQQPQGKVMT